MSGAINASVDGNDSWIAEKLYTLGAMVEQRRCSRLGLKSKL